MTPVTILYLDDDPSEIRLMRQRLKPHVVNTVIGFTTPDALYTYLSGLEDRRRLAILVDIMLGESNGYEVIRTLRDRYPDLAESPILAVTASDDRHMEGTAKVSGADAFIRKPTTMEDLVTAIGRPGWYQIELVAKED